MLVKYINIHKDGFVGIDEIEFTQDILDMAIGLDNSLGQKSTLKVIKEGELYLLISLPSEPVSNREEKSLDFVPF